MITTMAPMSEMMPTVPPPVSESRPGSHRTRCAVLIAAGSAPAGAALSRAVTADAPTVVAARTPLR